MEHSGYVEKIKIKQPGLNCRGWIADQNIYDDHASQLSQLTTAHASALGKAMIQSPSATKKLIDKLLPILNGSIEKRELDTFFRLMDGIAHGYVPNSQEKQKTVGLTLGSVIVFATQEILQLSKSAPMSVEELGSLLATVLSDSLIVTLIERIHKVNQRSFSTDDAVRKRHAMTSADDPRHPIKKTS